MKKSHFFEKYRLASQILKKVKKNPTNWQKSSKITHFWTSGALKTLFFMCKYFFYVIEVFFVWKLWTHSQWKMWVNGNNCDNLREQSCFFSSLKTIVSIIIERLKICSCSCWLMDSLNICDYSLHLLLYHTKPKDSNGMVHHWWWLPRGRLFNKRITFTALMRQWFVFCI